MSLNLSDVVIGDVLSENNLKPFWEKYRGYFFSGQLFASISLVYLTTTNALAVNCFPFARNSSETVEFSNTQAAVINAYCGNRLLWYVPFLAMMLLALSLGILFASSLWLNKPAVADSFRTFAEVDRIISDLNMTLRKLAMAVVKPIGKSSSERDLKVREAIMLVWGYNRKVDVKSIYLSRCKMLTGILLILAVLSLVGSILLFIKRDLCHCEVAKSDRDELPLNVDEFTCISRNVGMIVPFLTFASSISLFGQALMTTYAIRIVSKPKNIQSKSIAAEKNAIFMNLFWKNGSPSRSGVLEGFLTFAFSLCARREMGRNLNRAILDGDKDFIDKINDLNGGIPAMNSILYLMKEQLNEESERNIVDFVYSTEVKHKQCENIIKEASKMKRWEILLAILQIVTRGTIDKTAYNLPLLQEIGLNLDELNLPTSDGLAGSLLFYASRNHCQVGNAIYNDSLLCLLRSMWDNRVKYVHFCGKSMTLSQYYTKEFEVEVRDHIMRYADVPNYLDGSDVEPSRSQTEISKLYKEVKNVGEGPSEDYLKCLSSRIYRYKFTHWDDQARGFAQYLNIKRFWRELVTLLNAYIVTEDRRAIVEKLEGCGVTSFENVDEVFPIALQKQPLGFEVGYFVPTAARHILACCSPDQRRSCYKYIYDPTSGLNEENRAELLELIQKCNERDGQSSNSSIPVSSNETASLASQVVESFTLSSPGEETTLLTSGAAASQAPVSPNAASGLGCDNDEAAPSTSHGDNYSSSTLVVTAVIEMHDGETREDDPLIPDIPK